MIAVLTGDIIKSDTNSSNLWQTELKYILEQFGKISSDWEIYRGDVFQLELTDYKNALHVALILKSYLKIKNISVRIAIGLGEKSFDSPKIFERNGSAYFLSVNLLEKIKKQKVLLAVQSENIKLDATLNFLLETAGIFMDNWLSLAAEIVYLQLINKEKSQEEIAEILHISQAAISKRLKRAHFDLVKKLELYFSTVYFTP